MWRGGVGGLLLGLAGCVAGPPPATTASLAPRPPGWYAFCALHDPDSPLCDPLPDAVPMADGADAPTPPGWRDYCRRAPGDPSCPAP